MNKASWFLLLSMVACARFSPVGVLDREALPLRVMTYNIHHCNPPSAGTAIQMDTIAGVIRKEKPDLVALQEVDVNTERSGKGSDQARELARLTGMYYFFSKAIDYQGGDYGVAVLSRFPILGTERYPLPVDPVLGGEPRTMAVITVEVAKGRPVIFASTHLDLKEANRVTQAQLLVQHVGRRKEPVILAGDFNALPGSQVIQYLDQTFKRTCQPCAFTIPVDKPNRAIDFIMYRPGGAVDKATTRVIDEQYASDHLPVVADLILP